MVTMPHSRVRRGASNPRLASRHDCSKPERSHIEPRGLTGGDSVRRPRTLPGEGMRIFDPSGVVIQAGNAVFEKKPARASIFARQSSLF
jgi:hypothetical protein